MVISSRQNILIKEYRKLVELRKYRRQTGFFPCEGHKSVYEAIKCGCELGKHSFVSESAFEKYPEAVSLLAGKTEIITITDELAEYISDTKTPQGVFITVKRLDKILNLSKIEKSRRFLILENLQDAGNIGTIIRSCDAFSIDGIIFCGDNADVFAPKTVRSTMGSLFRLPLYFSDIENAVTLLRQGGFTVYAAELNENAAILSKEKFPKKTAVIIGNEGNGITDAAKTLCDKSLFIPISNAESLNASVAASVIAWELSKH